MGIHLVHATGDEVIAEMEIGPQHHQPYGIVHGGVHAGLIEAVTSVGAALACHGAAAHARPPHSGLGGHNY